MSGFLTDINGIARAGRLTLASLRQWNAAVVGHDFHADPEATGIPPGAGGIWVAHCNAPEAMGFMARKTSHLWARRYRIGYWAYELERIPDDWRPALDHFHEIWAPTRFVADAIASVAKPNGPPVRVVPHPLPARGDVRPDRPRFGVGSTFTCLSMFDGRSTFARKNPMGAVAAFQRAFTPKSEAALIVKVIEGRTDERAVAELRATIAGWPNIRLIEDRLSDDEVLGLIASVDTLISLHRSEGFGLTIAEAMTVGVPSVITAWSGSAEFAHGAAVEIPYRLVPVVDASRHYERPDLRWADPDLDAAAAALRRLAEDPAYRAELGRNARRLSAERLSGTIDAPHLAQFIAASGQP